MMSGNGSWTLRNLEDGADRAGTARAMRQFCSAMEIRVSERHLLGNTDHCPERGVKSC